MTITDLIRHLMPAGTDAYNTTEEENAAVALDYRRCPTWPADLFAVIGSIIDRSGCYTLATPDRTQLDDHIALLNGIDSVAREWNDDFMLVPPLVTEVWQEMIDDYGSTTMERICKERTLVTLLTALFAIADEASTGMGWDADKSDPTGRVFASITFTAMTAGNPDIALPYLPRSLCIMVPPERAVVLPKSITSSVGCTIRSLSHYLALLPPSSVLDPSWILSSTKPGTGEAGKPSPPYDINLLLVPFPFTIHADSFRLSSERRVLENGNHVPAYFTLEQKWLSHGKNTVTGQMLADELIVPLIEKVKLETGRPVDGVILPECALTSALAQELVGALKDSGIDFLITGAMDRVDGKTYNRALTYALQHGGKAAVGAQNKHHRWRLDRAQTDRYSLDFDPDRDNDKWWEDIDVANRQLPFFALRRDMSLATLVCEDLARTDPAMTAIRAVGPNLVVALLMDGPQLALRWPGRYATVLAEDPGSAVLSFTCAAMVDRSNWLEAKPARSIGLWRDGGGRTQEIGLPPGSQGVLLTLQSKKKHQNTLDNRSDHEQSRQLTLRTVVPLFLARQPKWL